MAKTQEELNALKEEIEALNRKLAELTEEELALVVGGKGNDDYVDWSVEDQSVPVTISDPCPRCHLYMLQMELDDQCKPIDYICRNPQCKYRYAPPEWKR